MIGRGAFVSALATTICWYNVCRLVAARQYLGVSVAIAGA